jgi:hypothetical protein
MQEAVHMVDKQELVICSDSMTYINISQGQVLCNDLEMDKRKDTITVYRNRKKKPQSLPGAILLPSVYLHHFQEN